jgi:hypothetical protein
METLGVRIFHRATKLSLEGPAYTDSAIAHLSQLKDLKSLTLQRTQISDQGLHRLRRALPLCRIERQQP